MPQTKDSWKRQNLSDDDLRTLDQWSRANAIFGLLLVMAMIAMVGASLWHSPPAMPGDEPEQVSLYGTSLSP
jgi:hypothetical protein